MTSKKKTTRKKAKKRRLHRKAKTKKTAPKEKSKSKKSAENKDRVSRPQNRDKALSAAYLRLLGASQGRAATEAGCAVRALRDWETCSWWPDMLAEARQRWLRGGDAAAMYGSMRAFKDPREYAQHSRWWMDRRIKELKPPSLQLAGEGGGPVKIQYLTIGDQRIEF